MQIIFHSEQEKERFIYGRCPSSLGIVSHCNDFKHCEDCWRDAVNFKIEERLAVIGYLYQRFMKVE